MSRSSSSGASPDAFARFEVRDGIRRVTVTVSNEALEAVSGLTAPSTPLLRRKSFDRFRTLINAAAKLKLRGVPIGCNDPIILTRADLKCVPPEIGVPSYGSSARGVVRAAVPEQDAPAVNPLDHAA